MTLQYQIVPVTVFVQNSTILWCDVTNHAAVVDPGGDLDRIESFVRSHQLFYKKILLTHGHVDHAGSAEELAKRHDIPIEGPNKQDSFWLDRLGEQARLFNFPHKVPDKIAMAIDWLHHKDQVRLGHELLEVLHCPGHTPGHIVFYSCKAQLAIVGDVLFKNSVGRSDLPQGDGKQLLQSIQNHLFVLPDVTQVIPGHGLTTTIGDEKHHNPYFAKP